MAEIKHLASYPPVDLQSDDFELVDLILNNQSPQFKNTLVLGVQHLHPSTYKMINSWVKAGLSPDCCYLLGKCYSTDLPTVRLLIDLGVKVADSSSFFRSHEPYDSTYQRNVTTFFDYATSNLKGIDRIIILDDGGSLLLHAMSKLNNLQRCSIVGVEQTSAGYHKLRNQKASFPIVNVARSDAKLSVESPLIAGVTQEKLRLLNYDFTLPKSILIVGYGPIGQAVHNILPSTAQIRIIDPAYGKYATKHGQLSPKDIEDVDLIIGCTGTCILQPRLHLRSKTRLDLMSLSSSDREFHAVSLRRLLPYTEQCDCDVEYGGIRLLNSGFPVNFHKTTKFVDTEQFELTRSLLTAGVCQAIRLSDTTKSGLQILDEKLQKLIVTRYLDKYKLVARSD